MSRTLLRRLEKLEDRRKPKQWPSIWYDFTPATGENGRPVGCTLVMGMWPEDPIPEACEMVQGLGWCLLDDENRREFQEEGRWDPMPGVRRVPVWMLP
jgi:hypothetical protein